MGVDNMARFGRPKAPKSKYLSLRLTEGEYRDMRKIAIAENLSLVDVVRLDIKRHKKRLQDAGRWPDSDEREGGDDGDT